MFYGESNHLFYPPARYNSPQSIPSQIFPSLDFDTIGNGITKDQAKYVAKVVFCKEKKNATCTHHHSKIETADLLLNYLNKIGPDNSKFIKKLSMMVRFSTCEFWDGDCCGLLR